jgi:hypothetical protein
MVSGGDVDQDKESDEMRIIVISDAIVHPRAVERTASSINIDAVREYRTESPVMIWEGERAERRQAKLGQE